MKRVRGTSENSSLQPSAIFSIKNYISIIRILWFTMDSQQTLYHHLDLIADMRQELLSLRILANEVSLFKLS